MYVHLKELVMFLALEATYKVKEILGYVYFLKFIFWKIIF